MDTEDSATAPATLADGPRPRRPRATWRAGQQLACGWCGDPIAVRSTGRIPKWCSDTCRHRAWEQSRAAASGRAAVQVVDREVEVAVPIPAVRTVEIIVPPRGPGWIPALYELARALDTGRFYDRDLPELADALGAVAQAYERRTTTTRRLAR